MTNSGGIPRIITLEGRDAVQGFQTLERIPCGCMVRGCGRRRGEVESAIGNTVRFQKKTIAPCYPILVQLLSDRRSEVEAGIIPDRSDYVHAQAQDEKNLELKSFVGNWRFSWFWIWSLFCA